MIISPTMVCLVLQMLTTSLTKSKSEKSNSSIEVLNLNLKSNVILLKLEPMNKMSCDPTQEDVRNPPKNISRNMSSNTETGFHSFIN